MNPCTGIFLDFVKLDHFISLYIFDFGTTLKHLSAAIANFYNSHSS